MRALDAEEASRLVEAVAETSLHALVYVALATGARLGELLGLRWADLDQDRGKMRVTRTAQRLRGLGIVFHAPKTHRANRPIALSTETLLVLREQRRAQAQERLALGRAYRDNGLVFARATGEPMDGPAVTKAFRKVAARAELGALRFHDLRHTAATLMLAAGPTPRSWRNA